MRSILRYLPALVTGSDDAAAADAESGEVCGYPERAIRDVSEALFTMWTFPYSRFFPFHVPNENSFPGGLPRNVEE